MNFSEQLAYWYLRLNGFFPLTNFVLHMHDGHRTSDTDLIAVRFPHVTEDIGGIEADWDEAFMKQWGIELAKETVGLIVEVKSGAWSGNDIENGGTERKTRDSLRRMGLLPREDIEEVCKALQTKPIARHKGFAFGRLLIGSAANDVPKTWNFLDLSAVDDFVRKRMSDYRLRKFPDKLFFSGDLIQYLAWKEGK